MRRFLYFFPGCSGMNSPMLAARGVLDRFLRSDGVLLEHTITPIDEGPSGMGVMVGLGSRPCEYAPDRQTWLQGETCWVGIDDAPPRPDDLVREVIVEGTDVLLANGSVWRVPLVVRWDREKLRHVPNLTETLTPVVRDGKVVVESSIRPQDRKLMDLAERVFMDFALGRVVPHGEAYPNAVAFLNVNYRLGMTEAGLLGLLTPECIREILMNAVDISGLQEHRRYLATRGLELSEPQLEPE